MKSTLNTSAGLRRIVTGMSVATAAREYHGKNPTIHITSLEDVYLFDMTNGTLTQVVGGATDISAETCKLIRYSWKPNTVKAYSKRLLKRNRKSSKTSPTKNL